MAGSAIVAAPVLANTTQRAVACDATASRLARAPDRRPRRARIFVPRTPGDNSLVRAPAPARMAMRPVVDRRRVAVGSTASGAREALESPLPRRAQYAAGACFGTGVSQRAARIVRCRRGRDVDRRTAQRPCRGDTGARGRLPDRARS